MTTTKTTLASDRFIGLRKEVPSDHLCLSTTSKDSEATAYSELISAAPSKCNKFSKKTKQSVCLSSRHSPSLVLSYPDPRRMQKGVRVLEADRVLSAPRVRNNFYYSLLDMNDEGDYLIGTEQGTFIHRYSTQVTQDLLGRSPSRSNCSVKFSLTKAVACIGNQIGELEVYCAEQAKRARKNAVHYNEIYCIQPMDPQVLLTGSRDNTINQIDLRLKNCITMTLIAHDRAVCGLSARENQVASGSIDGSVFIWDLRKKDHELKRINMHGAAVKAIDWCPWKRHLLGTGGGSNDHKIVLYDLEKDNIEEIIEGESQVTGLKWREESQDLVTSHAGSQGFAYAMAWNYAKKEFSYVLKGHHARITGLCVNRTNPEQVTTMSADDSLRLWTLPLDCPSKRSNISRESSKLRDPVLK